ncbi:MAG: hypothetical protein K2J58_02460, partial [Muribaculaceae bacterium]|nr:hypothetical protein [Muribaculaceae bacterium]
RLGSWLNSSVSAGYAAINDEDTRLNVWLQHNSTSLWQAWKEDAETGTPGADRRFRYDETIGADISHRILGKGTVVAALQYHLGYFNYYGTTGPDSDGRIEAPKQTINDIYASVGWTGANHGKLTYGADADVRYFGYRAMYVPYPPELSQAGFAKTKGERETAINVGGDIKYGLTDGDGNRSDIGVGLKYSGVINSIGNDVNRVEATPAYTLAGRNYSLRLGANLAVTGNGERTRLRIAPDVRFSARKGIVAFSASAAGGTYLRTLAWKHTMDYYADPTAGCYEAAYSPLDIRVGLQLNPGGRWTLGGEVMWRTTLDESFGGLYQALLNNNLSAYEGYPESGKIHGFSIMINAGYEFCRYFALKGRLSGQPQNGSEGVLNGFDRPKLTADLSGESKPTDRLSLRLDYRLRAKRQFHLSRLSSLDLSAEYSVTDRISVGLELNNVLNCHQELLPGLAMEGFNAMGGVQIMF